MTIVIIYLNNMLYNNNICTVNNSTNIDKKVRDNIYKISINKDNNRSSNTFTNTLIIYTVKAIVNKTRTDS